MMVLMKARAVGSGVENCLFICLLYILLERIVCPVVDDGVHCIFIPYMFHRNYKFINERTK